MSKDKTYIGIDIGKKGGIVILKPSPLIWPMPLIGTDLDYRTLQSLMVYNTTRIGGEFLVIFEKLQSIFGTSKATAFSMGHQAGAVEMMCIAMGLPFVKVPPKTWQKEMLLGTNPKSDTKARAAIAASNLFPGVNLKIGKSTKPHDGIVDALLMAEYGRRKL